MVLASAANNMMATRWTIARDRIKRETCPLHSFPTRQPRSDHFTYFDLSDGTTDRYDDHIGGVP